MLIQIIDTQRSTKEVVLQIFDLLLPHAYRTRFGETISIRWEESVSYRRFIPPGSYVFATVSRHILDVTKEGAVLANEGICGEG